MPRSTPNAKRQQAICHIAVPIFKPLHPVYWSFQGTSNVTWWASLCTMQSSHRMFTNGDQLGHCCKDHDDDGSITYDLQSRNMSFNGCPSFGSSALSRSNNQSGQQNGTNSWDNGHKLCLVSMHTGVTAHISNMSNSVHRLWPLVDDDSTLIYLLASWGFLLNARRLALLACYRLIWLLNLSRTMGIGSTEPANILFQTARYSAWITFLPIWLWLLSQMKNKVLEGSSLWPICPDITHACNMLHINAINPRFKFVNGLSHYLTMQDDDNHFFVFMDRLTKTPYRQALGLTSWPSPNAITLASQPRPEWFSRSQLPAITKVSCIACSIQNYVLDHAFYEEMHTLVQCKSI